MKGVIAAALCAVTLGGCASFKPAAPAPQNWTQWVCDTGARVFWRYQDANRQQVQVRLAENGQVYSLKAEPGADGALYSDAVLAFHVMGKGDEGLVYWAATNDLIGRGCKAP